MLPETPAVTRRLTLHQRTALNAASNIALFCVNFLVNLWFIPYLIHHLGVATYGIVPLVTTLVAYLSLVTLSLNDALGRFLTIELERGDVAGANKLFNTALNTSLLIAPFLAMLSAAIVYLAPTILRLPRGQEAEIQVLIGFVLLSFMLTAVESNFAVASWARKRFDLRNLVALASRLTQVGVVVLCFSFIGSHVSFAGVGVVAAAVVSFTGSVMLWRRLTPDLHVRLGAVEKTQLRSITGMSVWMLVNQIGSLLFLNMDLIVVNRLFGPEGAGHYGALLQLSIYVRSLANMLVSVLTPVVLSKFAVGDFQGMKMFTFRSVRLLGLVIALPVGLLCGFAAPLLRLWLGTDFVADANLLVLLCVPLAVNLAVLPVFSIQLAYGKVRIPGIVTLFMGLTNLGLAVALGLWTNLGAMGVALAGGIILTLKNAGFTTLYCARIQSLPWHTYLRPLLPGLVASGLLGAACYFLSSIFGLMSWFEVLSLGAAATLLYVALAFTQAITADERAMIVAALPGFSR